MQDIFAFVPNFSSKAYCISPSSMLVAGFHKSLPDCRYFLFLFHWNFYYEWVLNFVRFLSCMYWDDEIHFLLYYLTFQILNHPCLSTRVVMYYFSSYIIDFIYILLRIFPSVLWGTLIYDFWFLLLCLSGFGVGNANFRK